MGETQDQCDQKHSTLCKGETSCCRAAVGDRTAEEQGVEGLLTLILEDRSKNIIEVCGEACLAVGLLAPAHSLICFRDGMPSKPNIIDGKSYSLCRDRQKQ